MTVIIMERKVSIERVGKAVEDAFEMNKNIKEGTVSSLLTDVNEKAFGISVVLTDGTTINKGDTKVLSPLGRIALVPTHVAVLTQNTPDELVKKAGVACGKCSKENKPKGLAVSAHGVRAVSVVEPSNDPDGKWQVMIDNIINLLGSAPILDDKLYERLKAENAASNAVNSFQEAGYNLYDGAETSLDLFTRLSSLQLTTEQLAAMGATIAADGRNPLNGQIAFDGAIAANVVATMARGVHKEGRAWMMTVGLPAANSMGGAILAVLPGFGAIAAYAPALDPKGVSVKAAKAIRQIAYELQLNIYASARVKAEK